MTHPLIKICGITNPQDAQAAIYARANWLGLIFVPHTPRAISIEAATLIVEKIRELSPEIKVVGVFQNASQEIIQAHLSALVLDYVQLHGNESPEFCGEITAPLIKTLFIEPNTNFSELETEARAYLRQSNVNYLLLDLPKNGALKSLVNFSNLPTLKAFLEGFPCLLAGGLNAENISPILAQLQPVGVDVASGVEASPGQKDVDQMSAFCQIVQSFEQQRNHGDHHPCNP